jgi:hypothetical protein
VNGTTSPEDTVVDVGDSARGPPTATVALAEWLAVSETITVSVPPVEPAL